MQLFTIELLAKDLAGYHNLMKLSTIACTDAGDFVPRISHKLLEEHHDGLICLSGGMLGEVSQAMLEGGMRKAKKAAEWYKTVFREDFYLEVSLHKRERSMVASVYDNYMKLYAELDELYTTEKELLRKLARLGREMEIKLVATNPVRFLNRDDAVAHDTYCSWKIGQRMSDEDRPRFTHLEYLRSEKEMRKLFSYYPEAVDNAAKILDKIGRYSIHRDFSMPHVSDNQKQELRDAVYDGARKKYGSVDEKLRERIEYELRIITEKGYNAYFCNR
jgi:DNA polymerase-3 subunit alpha